jgi:hypothetical protein
VQDPDYINIGHRSLITNRGQSAVTINPGGILNDYIPFYFHYKMPMLYHIFKGMVKDYAGSQEEIIYLVSSAEKVESLGLPFVFTNRHAYLATKILYNQLQDLEKLRWDIIKDDTWYLQYTELRKELKQAEFLVHQHMPIDAILGIVANSEQIAKFANSAIKDANSSLLVTIKPAFYYL